MFVYVSMMIWTAFCGILSKGSESICIIEGKKEKRTNLFFALLTMAYIVLFMGTLCSAFDLTAYENNFNSTPNEPAEISEYIKNIPKYPGFYTLQIFFKTYISTEFHHWTLLLVSFDCIVMALLFSRYSENFALSVFIFIASGRVLWLGNAVKQLLAACIIFSFSKFLMEKKFWKFAFGVIIASLFHTSALIVLPVFFFVHGKPWNKKMLMILICSLLAITFVSSFSNILDFILDSTEYETYSDKMQTHSGSNILHFLIASVPSVLSLIAKKKVDKTAPTYINICINMSLVSSCIYLISSFTSGILMGRLPIYFEIYGFIALPWLFKNAFEPRIGKILEFACIMCYSILYYLVFFYSPYYSRVLNIYITP